MRVDHATAQHRRRNIGRRTSHCFAVDPATVSGLVYSNGAPKNEDGYPEARTPTERVRRAVWGKPYTSDARIVSTSPSTFARVMAVMVVVCQDFGLAISENKTKV